MIEYNTIINTLKTRIPEFSIDDSFVDNPIVAFSFLSSFIKEAYDSNHQQTIDKCITLINEMAEIKDTNIVSLVEEVSIGLYDYSSGIFEDFKSRLAPVAAEHFDKTIALWKNQPKN